MICNSGGQKVYLWISARVTGVTPKNPTHLSLIAMSAVTIDALSLYMCPRTLFVYNGK